MLLASISTSAVSLFVLGASFLFFAQVQGVLQEVQSQVELGIFLKKSSDRTDAEIVRTRVAQVEGVRQARLVDRDKAFSALLSELGSTMNFQDIVEHNPLPHAVRVKAESTETLDRVAQLAKKMPEVDEVVYPRQIAHRLRLILHIGQLSALLAIGFLVFATVILMVNTIRLSVFARRREIRIMQLVGASNWFIRLPFLIEGVFQGWLGALIASASLYLFYHFGLQRLPHLLPFLFSPLPTLVFQNTLFGLFSTGSLLGMLGSLIAISSHLEEP